jgi:hypothetical protein
MEVTMLTGGCHCGAIRYEVQGAPKWSSLCHCRDCRRHAGAPVVGWGAFPESAVRLVQGKPKIYISSEHGRRHFCGDCGTGLFYYNAVHLPGIADVQIATLDDPDAVAPQIHVQAAERIPWMERAHQLPMFERYPSKA